MEAADASFAIEIVQRQQNSIDLILTDVIMPGMTGADLIALLRPVNPKMAVLFMSGYAGDLITRAGISESEKRVIHKPFTKKNLLTKVRSILDEMRRS